MRNCLHISLCVAVTDHNSCDWSARLHVWPSSLKAFLNPIVSLSLQQYLLLLHPLLSAAFNISFVWSQTVVFSSLNLRLCAELAEPNQTQAAAPEYLIFSGDTRRLHHSLGGTRKCASITHSRTINFRLNLVHGIHSHEGFMLNGFSCPSSLAVVFSPAAGRAISDYLPHCSHVSRSNVRMLFCGLSCWHTEHHMDVTGSLRSLLILRPSGFFHIWCNQQRHKTKEHSNTVTVAGSVICGSDCRASKLCIPRSYLSSTFPQLLNVG